KLLEWAPFRPPGGFRIQAVSDQLGRSQNVKRETAVEIGVFSLLVVLGVVSRLAAAELHVWNFASVTASALFAGYYLSYRRVAFLVPLLIMMISNLWLPSYPHTGMLLVVYASFLLPVLLRSVLRYSLLTLVFCAVG